MGGDGRCYGAEQITVQTSMILNFALDVPQQCP